MQLSKKSRVLVVCLAFVSVFASPVPDKNYDIKPTLTTQTFTFTGVRVYDTIVSYSPYWLTATDTIVWTQTATNLVYPAATPQA